MPTNPNETGSNTTPADAKPYRSIPDKIAIALDDMAIQDDADLSRILGMTDRDDDEPVSDEPPVDDPA